MFLHGRVHIHIMPTPIKFLYRDMFGTEREASGVLVAVRGKLNEEGIVLCQEGTRERLCMVRANDGGTPAWVMWVDRVPGADEGWHAVRLPGRRARDDEGWSGVIMWAVLAFIAWFVVYGSRL